MLPLLLFSGFKLNFLKSQIVRFLENSDLQKVEDQDTTMILKWPEVLAVVLVLTLLLDGGQGPTPELWFCLWLSFIQITESCIWEP